MAYIGSTSSRRLKQTIEVQRRDDRLISGLKYSPNQTEFNLRATQLLQMSKSILPFRQESNSFSNTIQLCLKDYSVNSGPKRTVY